MFLAVATIRGVTVSITEARRLPDGAEVAGFVVLGYVNSAEAASPVFGQRMEEQLSRRGIEDPQQGEWYPARPVQTAFAETADGVGEQLLVNAGKEIASLYDWPADVDTLDAALSAMDDAHSDAHRRIGSHDIGGYEVVSREDRSARVVSDGFPYPTEVARGAIEGTVERFKTTAGMVTVEDVSADSDYEIVFDASW
mgnify:FL=1